MRRVSKGNPSGGQFARHPTPDTPDVSVALLDPPALPSPNTDPTRIEMWHYVALRQAAHESPSDEEPWALDRDCAYEQVSEPTPKPNGLWLELRDSDYGWLEFCAEHDFGEDAYEMQTVTVDTTKLLVLESPSDLDARYVEHSQFLEQPLPRWDLVANDYAGVVFPNYSKAPAKRLLWWYNIDVSSACIWDLAAIQTTRPQGTARVERPARDW